MVGRLLLDITLHRVRGGMKGGDRDAEYEEGRREVLREKCIMEV